MWRFTKSFHVLLFESRLFLSAAIFLGFSVQTVPCDPDRERWQQPTIRWLSFVRNELANDDHMHSSWYWSLSHSHRTVYQLLPKSLRKSFWVAFWATRRAISDHSHKFISHLYLTVLVNSATQIGRLFVVKKGSMLLQTGSEWIIICIAFAKMYITLLIKNTHLLKGITNKHSEKCP